jgi:hypothetical protein
MKSGNEILMLNSPETCRSCCVCHFTQFPVILNALLCVFTRGIGSSPLR